MVVAPTNYDNMFSLYGGETQAPVQKPRLMKPQPAGGIKFKCGDSMQILHAWLWFEIMNPEFAAQSTRLLGHNLDAVITILEAFAKKHVCSECAQGLMTLNGIGNFGAAPGNFSATPKVEETPKCIEDMELLSMQMDGMKLNNNFNSASWPASQQQLTRSPVSSIPASSTRSVSPLLNNGHHNNVNHGLNNNVNHGHNNVNHGFNNVNRGHNNRFNPSPMIGFPFMPQMDFARKAEAERLRKIAVNAVIHVRTELPLNKISRKLSRVDKARNERERHDYLRDVKRNMLRIFCGEDLLPHMVCESPDTIIDCMALGNWVQQTAARNCAHQKQRQLLCRGYEIAAAIRTVLCYKECGGMKIRGVRVPDPERPAKHHKWLIKGFRCKFDMSF